MSTFTKASNFLHDQLLTGAGTNAMGHIGSGAAAGAAIGAGASLMTGNDTLLGGTLSGAAKGALLGAGTRYASMQYAKGVSNFIGNTVDRTTGKMFNNVQQSTVEEIGKFKFGHFVRPNTNNVHASYWDVNSTAYKQTPFQQYNPRFTDPTQG